MYTKFLMRIQRVIMKAFGEHTKTLIGIEAAQQAMGVNFSDIVDSQMMTGISLSGGRTQLPDEVAETLFQIPLFQLLGGVFK